MDMPKWEDTTIPMRNAKAIALGLGYSWDCPWYSDEAMSGQMVAHMTLYRQAGNSATVRQCVGMFRSVREALTFVMQISGTANKIKDEPCQQ